MQRDMGLIRQIMFKLEAEPGGFAPQDFTIEDYLADQVSYHVYLLGQARLLEVEKKTNLVSSAPSALAVNLTWEGHDFIDAARSDTTWSRAIEKTKTVGGSLSFAVFKQLLESILKAQLGL
jgi:hypothetical protein